MKKLRQIIGRLALLGVAVALTLSGMARIVSANLALRDDAPAAVQSADSGVAIDEMELLVGQLMERERAVAAREARLEERAQDLDLAKAALAATLEELAEAEAALEARMFASDSASETDLAGLTAIYEGMKPKDAAALFDAMDPEFAAGFLARMAPDAAAAIFSNLPPMTAYAVSATIAGRNTNAATGMDQ